MKTRKTIVLFAVFSISLLLLAGCEMTDNSLGNNQNINTVASPENNKQEEPKPEEQKEEQIVREIDAEAKNDLSQIKIEAGNNLSGAEDNNEVIKEEVKAEEIKNQGIIKR